MAHNSNKLSATISILTYNGERYIEEILEAVEKQKVDFKFEILVVDSGSRDGTLEVVRRFQMRYDNIRLHSIPNAEFGHGKTRNLVAELAKGEYVVYLTHDATPADTRWLYELLKPFELSDDIVGVMGRQVPRPHCIPMLKHEINGVFSNFGPNFGTSIFYKDSFINDQGTYDAVRFYSDVNSAARKKILLGKIPYRDVSYAEDQLFGQDIIEAGYMKAYAPRGAVIHSNDLKLSEYKKRMFDETMGLRKSGITMNKPSRKLIIRMIFKGVIKDALLIVRDKDYSLRRKCYWILLNPFFHVEKWRGVRAALTADLSDNITLHKHSLEKSRQNSSQ